MPNVHFFLTLCCNVGTYIFIRDLDTQVSNLIYVDQPTGTGFSYSSDDEDIRHNEEGVSNDLYDFLQVCFSKYALYFHDYNFPCS